MNVKSEWIIAHFENVCFAEKLLNRRRSIILSKMSECWLRKMRTHFRRIDFDNNGIMSKRDFELMAESICAAEKIDPVKEEKLKKHAGDVSWFN